MHEGRPSARPSLPQAALATSLEEHQRTEAGRRAAMQRESDDLSRALAASLAHGQYQQPGSSCHAAAGSDLAASTSWPQSPGSVPPAEQPLPTTTAPAWPQLESGSGAGAALPALQPGMSGGAGTGGRATAGQTPPGQFTQQPGAVLPDPSACGVSGRPAAAPLPPASAALLTASGPECGQGPGPAALQPPALLAAGGRGVSAIRQHKAAGFRSAGAAEAGTAPASAPAGALPNTSQVIKASRDGVAITALGLAVARAATTRVDPRALPPPQPPRSLLPVFFLFCLPRSGGTTHCSWSRTWQLRQPHRAARRLAGCSLRSRS
jgi:hypothetical protein